jgi:hypothetical protein
MQVINTLSKPQVRQRIVIFLLFYIICYKIADALTIHTHGDTFYYHLAGAKTFLNHGISILAHDNQGYAQGGLFDLLYFIPFFFTKNLISIQLIAQEMHLLFSLFLGAFLFKKWIPNRMFALLGAISLITIARDFAFFLYAKNDGVVAVAALFSSYLIYKNRSLFWIGLSLALIPTIKMSGVIASAVLGICFIYKNRSDFKRILIVIITAAIFVLPALIKNNYFTGDPFFPILINVFHSKLSLTSQEYYQNFFAQPPTLDSILLNFNDLLFGKLVYWIGFFLAYLKIKRKDWDGLIFFVAAIGIFLIYTFSHGLYQGARFFFSVYFLLIFFTFFELSKTGMQKKYFWPLIFVILIDGNIGPIWSKLYGNISELTHHSQEELLRKKISVFSLVTSLDRHPQKETFIYSDCKPESFHLDPNYRLIHYENSRQSDFFQTCSAQSDVDQIKQFRYFWISKNIDNICYKAIFANTNLISKVEIDGETVRIYERKTQELDLPSL